MGELAETLFLTLSLKSLVGGTKASVGSILSEYFE
jgi:hypothetical protein